MKNSLKFFSLAALLVSTNAFSYSVNKIEVFPPFVTSGCSDLKTDYAGNIGLVLNKLTASESDDSIKISVEQTLNVCVISQDADGNKKLEWKKVNPYAGFEVQYYDVKTKSIKTRTETIDPDSKANRFEAVLFIEGKKVVARDILTNDKSKASSADLEMNKLDLLDQNEIDVLDSGKDLKKTVILFNTLNTTTTIDGEKTFFGDLVFSGRNVTLTLSKVKDSITVKSISVK